MHGISRRQFIATATRATVATLVFPLAARAEPACRAAHPLTPPDPGFHGRCPNCGMGRSMWARTWKTFRTTGRCQEACSFHCLADMAVKSGVDPSAVMTALFLEPRGMVPAGAAWFVVGSAAAGTMSMISKAAFATRPAAEAFARVCGGVIQDFAATYRMAVQALSRENAAIDRKRLATGKIVPPGDGKDECILCRMYPARYPRHRCQIRRRSGQIAHFCSTHCLFIWLGDGFGEARKHASPGMIWVTDFVSGRWISGRTAYYVVGSGHNGPMGAEAVAFDRREQALAFAREKGGRVLIFDQVEAGSSAWTLSAWPGAARHSSS